MLIDGAAPVGQASAQRATSTRSPAGGGCARKMPPPGLAERIAGQPAPRHVAQRREDREGDDLAARAARDAEGAGQLLPPRPEQGDVLGRLVACGDRRDGRTVVSHPGRAGLGTQAGEARLREVLQAGGFGPVRRAIETPLNLVLEARL